MTTGFDQQEQPAVGPILRQTPKPQTIGAKLDPAPARAEDRPLEPRTFQTRRGL